MLVSSISQFSVDNQARLKTLVQISEASRKLPPEKRAEIEQQIVESMKLLEANNQKIEQAKANLNSRVDNICHTSKKFREPKKIKATPEKSGEVSLTGQARAGLKKGVEAIPEEKRSLKEVAQDMVEQIALWPTKSIRESVASEVENRLGPSTPTDLAMKASKFTYTVGRLTGQVEENELAELAFEVHDARKKVVDEVTSLIKEPCRTVRRYVKKSLS